jgi:hypothetical protein
MEGARPLRDPDDARHWSDDPIRVTNLGQWSSDRTTKAGNMTAVDHSRSRCHAAARRGHPHRDPASDNRVSQLFAHLPNTVLGRGIGAATSAGFDGRASATAALAGLVGGNSTIVVGCSSPHYVGGAIFAHNAEAAG